MNKNKLKFLKLHKTDNTWLKGWILFYAGSLDRDLKHLHTGFIRKNEFIRNWARVLGELKYKITEIRIKNMRGGL